MYLSRVEVQNFRSLESLAVDLRPGLNVLVGRNNTGKSNFLQAIRHALGPNASRGDMLWLDRDDFFRESPTDSGVRTIKITLTFSGLDESQRAHFYEIVDFDTQNLANSTAVLRFEASWPPGKKRCSIRRTGGSVAVDAPEVPSALLESLPITFLPALRDAEASLAPGHRSRLAALLQDVATRKGGTTQADLEGIFFDANRRMEADPLIKQTTKSLQTTSKGLAGSDFVPSTIRAADLRFERILRSLQVQMDGSPVCSLDGNGLGYNNLLYMAVVLQHLKSPDAHECPLLLVEEPEAHLHPQLTMLLADYLTNDTPGSNTPQTIITTHSPTLAASIPPSRIHVFFSPCTNERVHCASIADADPSKAEELQLERMLDITRATIYFAKGVILVEGICEALLMPELARRLGHDLRRLHISIIPICGVAFQTFKKLLAPGVLGIPVAIVTDADPEVHRGDTWESDLPGKEDGVFKVSERALALESAFSGHDTVEVFRSQVTLEYDLAEAGDTNANAMAKAWEACFVGTPGTFNTHKVEAAGSNREAKALAAWRGICRANPTHTKAEFVHQLAAFLARRNASHQPDVEFTVPQYLVRAIEYVVNRVQPAPQSAEEPSP